MDREAWQATVHGVKRVRHNLVTKLPPPPRTAAASVSIPRAGHCHPTALQETLRHSQADLAQSPIGSLPLSPESWCAQGFWFLFVCFNLFIFN